ncbi:zinc ABC transporter substrate-binding protein [Helicobacter pylori]|nr:zinc ABC transporter substrate-binding protein [Helicobacter pylori]
MIKTAKLPQGHFITQGGRENIYYFKPFYKNKAVCLGFLVIATRIKQ